jgi:hypothetical protein
MDEQHTRLNRRLGNVSYAAMEAAKEAADKGASPRGQIDAARAASGKKLVYLPHVGARERERNLRRIAKARARADEAKE